MKIFAQHVKQRTNQLKITSSAGSMTNLFSCQGAHPENLSCEAAMHRLGAASNNTQTHTRHAKLCICMFGN
jgi:hypothetical protein